MAGFNLTGNDITPLTIGASILLNDSSVNGASIKDALNWLKANSGGADAFVELDDTPGSFSGQGQKFVKVNSAENALEFVSVAENLIHEDLTAQVGDGTPEVFEVSYGYRPQSLVVFKNGLAQIPGASGNIEETDTETGVFTFTDGIPTASHTVTAMYIKD